jgi:hypothetical protein
MRLAVLSIVPMVLAMASAANAQDVAIRSLVDRFEAARLQFDPAALTKTLAPNTRRFRPLARLILALRC